MSRSRTTSFRRIGDAGHGIGRNAGLDLRAASRAAFDPEVAADQVDPRLPDVEAGIALIAGMSRAWPSMRIVLTGWGDTEGHAQLADARLCYVSKGGSPEDFVSAIVDACCPV